MDLNKKLKASIEFERNKRATKLIDFTYEQLDDLLAAVTCYMMDREQHCAHYDKYELANIVPFSKSYLASKAKISNCQLFITQIMTAMDQVRIEEAELLN